MKYFFISLNQILYIYIPKYYKKLLEENKTANFKKCDSNTIEIINKEAQKIKKKLKNTRQNSKITTTRCIYNI